MQQNTRPCRRILHRCCDHVDGHVVTVDYASSICPLKALSTVYRDKYINKLQASNQGGATGAVTCPTPTVVQGHPRSVPSQTAELYTNPTRNANDTASHAGCANPSGAFCHCTCRQDVVQPGADEILHFSCFPAFNAPLTVCT